MANWTILKKAIADVIKTNGNQEITGQLLQNTLNSIVNAVGENATFVGVATPSTNPGAPDGPVFYLAITDGIYSNFDGLLIDGESAIFINTKSGWIKYSIGISSEKAISLNSIKSNIGWLKVYSNTAVVIENKTITINEGWDMYHANRFFRGNTFARPQTIQLLSGAGIIYLDIKDKTFKISSNNNVINEHTIVIGVSYGSKATIFATSYMNNGKIVGLDHAISAATQFDINSKTNPTSNYDVVRALNKVATFVTNAKVEIEDKTVKLGAGEYSFYPRVFDTSYVCRPTTDKTFTFTESGQCLIFSTKNSDFQIKNKKDISLDDILLLFYDSYSGVCDGLWYTWLIVKTIPGHAGYFSNAHAVIDTESNIVKISGDIYVASKKSHFTRFTDINFQFTPTGTNGVVYNYINKTFRISDALSKNGDCLVGVKSVNKFYFNGDITCEYKHGNDTLDKTYDVIAESKIKSIAGDIADNTLPGFIFRNAADTFIRFMDWSDGEDVFLLAQITDVHSGGTMKYKSIGWLNSINSIFNFNILCNFGDIGLDTVNTNGNKEKSYELVINTKKLMYANSPWIFTKGNHEKVENNGISSDKKFGEIFNKSEKRIFDNIILSPNGDYGYIDNSNIRTIFLNTSENATLSGFAISTNQLQWLINTINSTPENCNIVIVSHVCVDEIGRWSNYPNDVSSENFNALREIYKSLANHTSGINENLNLHWDFSKNINSKLVCCLSGDSHFNNYIKRDGVNYIVRQGYAAAPADVMPIGATIDNFDWTRQCLFDVLAVKADGSAGIFRIGAGGKTRDVLFTY